MAEGFQCIQLGLAAREPFAATPAFHYAIDLAKHSGGCLTVCALTPGLYLPVMRSGGSAAAILQREIERLEETARETARSAREKIVEAGVACISDYTASPMEPRTDRLTRLARVNDITILDAAEPQDNRQRIAIEDVLFESGRPLIVVPRSGGKAEPKRIAIAWDGSARCARAVADAMPFLKNTGSIFVITVTGEKDLSRMAPGADLATYLVHHGIYEPRLETLSAPQGDAAARLRKFLKDERIDMMVMGAFVHSRFRQAILGGVTRSLLDDVPAPLFMAY